MNFELTERLLEANQNLSKYAEIFKLVKMNLIKQALIFLISVMLYGCDMDKTDVKIVKLNESVAKTNQCKLKAEVKKSNSEKILELTLESKYENPNLPGKILIDYYNIIQSNGFKVNKFIIRNNKALLYSIEEVEAQKLSEIIKNSNSVFINGNLSIEKLYMNLGDSTKGQVSYYEFANQLDGLKADLLNHTYIGFEIYDSFVGVRHINDRSMIEFVYLLDSKEIEIIGFKIQ